MTFLTFVVSKPTQHEEVRSYDAEQFISDKLSEVPMMGLLFVEQVAVGAPPALLDKPLLSARCLPSSDGAVLAYGSALS